jgi:hypothetical protein
MPNLTIINLNSGDTQEDLINKINQNFDSIVANGGGPQGADGKQGDQGPVGPEGPIGDAGVPGERGTRWFISNSSPSPQGGTAPNSEILIGDYWVNTTPSSNKEVSIYATGGWVSTGQSLQAQEIFTTLTGITGPSNTLKNAIVQSSSTPENNTFVLSDSPVTTVNANPTYSKFLIATDSTNGFPLLEFSKSNYATGGVPSDYNKHPYFSWKNPTTPDYSIKFVAPSDSLDILSAKNLNLQSTNGSITVSGISASLTGNTSMSFTTSGLLSLNSGTSNLLISSNQFNLSGTSASFNVPVSISGPFSGVSMASFVNTSTGGGIGVNLTGTSSTSRFLASFSTTERINNVPTTSSKFSVRSDGKIKFDKTLYAYSTNSRGGTGDYQADGGKYYNIVGPNVITNGNIAMVNFVTTGPAGAGIAIPLTPGPTGFSSLIGDGESYQMNVFSSTSSNTISGISLTTNGTSSLTSATFTATTSVSINIIRLTSSWVVYYDTTTLSGILTA